MSAPATVLIVDDAAVNRALVAATLRSEGYRLIEAADGRAALAQVARESPGLMILDLMMPGIDGAETLRLLRGEPGARPRVLLMSALGDKEAVEKARELGVDGHLSKPFEPRELREKVRRMLAAAPEAA